MPMQFSGLTPPIAGQSLDATIHSAAWMAKLVQAATSRNFTDLSANPFDPYIELTTTGLTLPQGSVIGAIGATYPGSPTVEPNAYMAATIGYSEHVFYTKNAHVTANTSIAAYPFLPGVPVRVRCANPGAYAYTPGISVGRADGDDVVSINGGGLVLISPPYTPDAGTNYYCWVMAGNGQSRLQVVLTSDLFAAVNTKRDPSTAPARVLVRKLNGDLTLSTRSVTVVNRFMHIHIDAGTYAKVEWLDGEWSPYAADCSPGSSSGP